MVKLPNGPRSGIAAVRRLHRCTGGRDLVYDHGHSVFTRLAFQSPSKVFTSIFGEPKTGKENCFVLPT